MGTVVSNVVITLCVDIWLLVLSWQSVHNVINVESLYGTPETNRVVRQLYCNKREKNPSILIGLLFVKTSKRIHRVTLLLSG